MGRSLILETTFLIDLEREHHRSAGSAVAFLEANEDARLYLPFIVAGELAAGTPLAHRTRWEAFLAPFYVLPSTPDVSWEYRPRVSLPSRQRPADRRQRSMDCRDGARLSHARRDEKRRTLSARARPGSRRILNQPPSARSRPAPAARCRRECPRCRRPIAAADQALGQIEHPLRMVQALHRDRAARRLVVSGSARNSAACADRRRRRSDSDCRPRRGRCRPRGTGRRRVCAT